VTISGPPPGLDQTEYNNSATIAPNTTSLPITYQWQASQQRHVFHANVVSTDMITFTWPVTGTQAITVFASNAAGSVSDTHTIALTATTPPCCNKEQTITYLPLILK
jgi:hypothetical protein